MQIEDRIAVEADIVGRTDQEFDRILVVEDHLRVEMCPTFRLFAEFNEALCVQKRVGVALQPAGIPGEVDEEPAEDVPGVGSRRLPGDL